MGPSNGTSWTVMICNIRKWTSCAPTHALWHVSHNCKKFRWWCGLDDYQSRAVTPLYYPSGMASWRQDNKEKGKCHAVGSRLTGAECLALLMGASRIRCRSEGTWMVSTLSRRWRARPSTLLASACGRRSAVHVDKAVDGVRVVYVSIARYLSIADKFLYQFVTLLNLRGRLVNGTRHSSRLTRTRRWMADIGDGSVTVTMLGRLCWRRRMAGLGMAKDRLIRHSAFVHLDISKTKGQTCE